MEKPDAKLIYETLLNHDGRTLRPELPSAKQHELTLALDRLRLKLLRQVGS